MSQIILCETYGSADKQNSFALCDGIIVDISTNNRKTLQSVSDVFRRVFLPQGYPESVSTDYLEYQLWDTIQAFSSSITGSLATQAVLKGVGVGDESATVLAATTTWLLKDGTGMMGRIFFAWLKGLFADVLNDVAIFLDILAPYFTSIFRIIVCVSGVFRAVVGVAGGATRAAITQHQAKRNNMADVSAKDGSQETLVNLMGLICSLILTPLVEGNNLLVWFFFTIFTFLHLFSNYRAVKCVVMDSFNQSRFNIFVNSFLLNNHGLSVSETNSAEPVFLGMNHNFNIHLGCSLKSIVMKRGWKSIIPVKTMESNRYLLGVDFENKEINISLHSKSSSIDQLRSCYHAEVIKFCFQCSLQKKKLMDSSLNYLVSLCSGGEGNVNEILERSYDYVQQTWGEFSTAVENTGWNTSFVLFGADEWRCSTNTKT